MKLVDERNYRKYTGIMRDSKSPGDLNFRMRKSNDEQYINSGDLYCNAIENADGVPFQLIFGQRPGDGYYVNVGRGIQKLLGVSSEEFTEKMFNGMIEKIIPLDNNIPRDMSESRRKFLSGELNRYKAEVLIRMPSGEKKWIQDSSLPLIDDETGCVIGAFGILFDINDRKQNLLHLELEKEKAEESDRLKSAFLHNISHEIRTPLNAIVGFSTLLGAEDEDRDKRQEYIDIIFKSSDHLLEIFDDMVEITNIEANNVTAVKEEINLNARLGKVYEQFMVKAAEKKINLTCFNSFEDSNAIIITDGYKLSRVLNSLVGNAIKFTKAGKVEFGYYIKGDKIEFFVSDTGIGIAPEYKEFIFNRFYQVDSSNIRRYEGTGLGLSISRAYVELLGGEIWFISQPGAGSLFCFTLPLERVGG
jgi:signal transduction histidine kinase